MNIIHNTAIIMYTMLIVSSMIPGLTSQPDATGTALPSSYYPFRQSLNQQPPTVLKPPYLQRDTLCPGLDGNDESPQTLNNLCGDLNTGTLPLNPMGQNVLGASYPFELIKNKTLEFFSRTLPILKDDKTMPKVAKLTKPRIPGKRFPSVGRSRSKRSETQQEKSGGKQESVASGRGFTLSSDMQREMLSQLATMPSEDVARTLNFLSGSNMVRQARAFCENDFGIICKLVNFLRGNWGFDERASNLQDEYSNSIPGAGLPATPCPSRSDYVTPAFGKNYQGVWRYVVQIPYEGYFTQTVENVECLNSACHYLEGSCLSSPRWVSLLVAEIFYPESYFPTTPIPFRGNNQDLPPPVRDFQKYQQYLKERADTGSTIKPAFCDGYDDLGCYQVRMYYDWFLIPGACKCWRSDYFNSLTGSRRK